MGFSSDDEFEYGGEIIETPDEGLFEKKFPANSKLDIWEDLDKLNYPWFINGIINRLNHGFAPIVVVCGAERVGKSTMAVDIIWRLVQAGALDYELDKESIQERLAYKPETFLEIITESDGRQPVLIDEAGVVAGSSEHQTKQNRIIKKTIQTMGYKQNVYVFILPDFQALDKKVRNKVDFKIELYDRGKAQVTGIKTNFGKMRSNEYDFYKQPLPAYWMSDFDTQKDNFEDEDKAEAMNGYDEKEKKFKQENAEEMLEELEEEKRDDDVITQEEWEEM